LFDVEEVMKDVVSFSIDLILGSIKDGVLLNGNSLLMIDVVSLTVSLLFMYILVVSLFRFFNLDSSMYFGLPSLKKYKSLIKRAINGIY